ncbi:glycosyltransferase [Curtobacterium sp. MCLR17_007]|uniref:glycosyltransferase n=1 Tax=Curtobacterium sp. MCLR17_007 TaxID=2175648 RepID=UPI000DAA7A69|nr:glycosyltransferase [Curtobacterium sp. MCLR17_007]WIB60762.1 glycosyltransferase [Curtobacterium sp. MCLR17_007]
MPGLIAHEWIAPHGGSENVAEAMGRAFPDADVVALWNDAPNRFAGHDVSETWLARSPLRRSKAAALPFMSPTWSRIDTSQYDFVLASSHVFAHHVGGNRGARKFAYVHTPARTIWAPEQDSRGANAFVRALAPAFRALDRRFVRPDVTYAANSRYIRDRIRSVWGVDAAVVYPPVDVAAARAARTPLDDRESAVLAALPDRFVLGASRFVPYKRLDLVIEAGAAAGIPVVIAGAGPLAEDLARRAAEARVPVSIVEAPSDALLRTLYRRASAFVFPAVEDFGIMPVEAMAAGTPAVVYREGGASESVELVEGGAVVDSLTPAELASGIVRALEVDMRAVPDAVEASFGEHTFAAQLTGWMTEERSA